MRVSDQVGSHDLLLAALQPADVVIAHDVVSGAFQPGEFADVVLQAGDLPIVHFLGGFPFGDLDTEITQIDGEVGSKNHHLVEEPFELVCSTSRAWALKVGIGIKAKPQACWFRIGLQ
jgi:hypothetical protein